MKQTLRIVGLALLIVATIAMLGMQAISLMGIEALGLVPGEVTEWDVLIAFGLGIGVGSFILRRR